MDRPARILVLLLAGVFALSGAAAWPASRPDTAYKVIVNASNPVTTISAQDASMLFLKKIPEWQNGIAVEPVDLHKSSNVREDFSEDIHGKSVFAVQSYWHRIIFSGKDTPPPSLRTDEDVVAFVAGRPGAIGYISRDAALANGVKVIQISY